MISTIKSVGLCTHAEHRESSCDADTPPRVDGNNDDDEDDASVFASGALARLFILDGVVFTKDGNDADAA